jgi:predicted extracellular nuclease
LFKPPSTFGPKNDAEYDAKLAALAGAITAMDPHVLAVQEVGDPAALSELADRVGGTWWHIETADPEAGTDHAIRVGILSRVVLTRPTQVSAFPDKRRAIQQGDGQDDDTNAMGRPALHVRVRLGGVDIEIITSHFNPSC